MIAKSFPLKQYASVAFFLFTSLSFSQIEISSKDESNFYKSIFYDYRGSNTVDVALGSSVINGDLPNPIFEIYSHIGYKRFLFPHLNINVSYNKFNLAYKDIYNEGYMSFDLNMEFLMLPYQKFTPYVFFGGGYNASNYFNETAFKAQGGIGIEQILADRLGVKLFADYNYVFTDELDRVVFGDSDDVYWRIGLGLNFYFGGNQKKEKLLEGIPTIINSNPIIPK